MKSNPGKIILASIITCLAFRLTASNPPERLLNRPADLSSVFRDLAYLYYLADDVSDFDPATHSGKIIYQRAHYSVRHTLNNDLAIVKPAPAGANLLTTFGCEGGGCGWPSAPTAFGIQLIVAILS